MRKKVLIKLQVNQKVEEHPGKQGNLMIQLRI